MALALHTTPPDIPLETKAGALFYKVRKTLLFTYDLPTFLTSYLNSLLVTEWVIAKVSWVSQVKSENKPLSLQMFTKPKQFKAKETLHCSADGIRM